jgi:hypothetical protein
MRRARALHVVGALLIFTTISGSPPARAVGDQFGGYQASSSGSGLTAAPVLPAVLPLETPFEGTLSLATTSLSSGGRGFGRASTVWPGTLVAGLRPLLEIGSGQRLPIPDYPIVVEQKEYEDAKHSESPGITMSTDVKPEHAIATATDAGVLVPAVLSVGSISTVSESSLEVKTITSTVTTTLNGIDIAAGALHIDSIESKALAASDAKTATCGGGVKVTGATVGGTPVQIDETGVHAQGQSVLPGVDLNGVVAGLLGASGVEVRTLGAVDGCDGALANRTTGGVLLSIPLPAVPPVPPGGKVYVILGSTTASAGASVPFTFTPSPPSNPPTPALVASRAPGPATGGLLSSNTPLPSQAGPRPGATVPATQPISYTFGGVPVLLVIGLLLAAVPGSRRIRRYLERLVAAATPL